MQAQQAPFFRPVQTSSYFRVNHQPAPRTTPQPQRQQQTRSNFFKPTSSQTTKQRGEYMLSIACKHFTDIGKKLLSTPCTQMVITAIYLYTHTHPAEPELAEATQQTQKGGDRLSALHCRLQQEAEKIRKWKNATEVEIKQKVHTVISLRKRLTKIWDCSEFACN